jgi:hypothetical protein
LDGSWEAVELRTEKGALVFEAGGITLHLDRCAYRFTTPDSEGVGKVVIRAGRFDLVSAKATLYRTYRLDGDKLTIAVWSKAADRQDTPSTDKGGIVFTFARKKPDA